MLQGCGGIENEIIPLFPTYSDAACLAETQGWYQAPGATDLHAGRAMEILSTGSGPTGENDYRWQVTGAPGVEDDEDLGYVTFSFTDIDSGLLDPSAGWDLTVAPPSGTFYQFGWELLSADFRDCYPGSIPGKYDACGQELLASAPDTFVHTSKGRVLWWESDGDVANSLLQYGGEIPAPLGSSTSAEFGWAMAAGRHPADPDAPWNIAGAFVDWLAISAPGDEKVHIYAVNPSSTTPYTKVQALSAPVIGRRFGHDLAVGDFDGDGLDDLAVSGPQEDGSDARGFTWVYHGQYGPQPLMNPPDLRLEGAGLGAASTDITHFGWSLAAGPIISTAAGDALVVGAPLVDQSTTVPDDDGGLCEHEFDVDGAGKLALVREHCWHNDLYTAQNPGTDEHLGWSVAIGNFHNTDNLGGSDNDEALQPELAVGRPGYNVDEGAVEIFLTGEDGFDENVAWNSILEWTGPYAGARFGDAIGRGYVQATHWEDLAIGAPEHPAAGKLPGTGSLTKAVDNAPCTDINGYWEGVDLDGDTVTFKVWWQDDTPPSVHVKPLASFRLGLFEDYGGANERLCQSSDGEGGMEDATFNLKKDLDIELPGTWTCGATKKTWADVDAGPVLQAMGVDVSSLEAEMDVVLNLVSSTEMRLNIKNIDIEYSGVGIGWGTAMTLAGVDDPDCYPEKLPIHINLISVGVCE